jgi:hypothetical protein
MQHRTIANRGFIVGALLLQVVPFLMFPARSFAATSQEWWLPILLLVLVVAADIHLIFRRSTQLWPWHLLSFAHGFNVISRLMMLWPHATRPVGGQLVIDAPYVALSCASMAISGFLLWYLELPDVRLGLVRS